MNSDQLAKALVDLAAIADDGRLSDLLLAFGVECRERGGLPADEERARTLKSMQVGAVVKAKEVARAASFMFGLPQADCEAAALNALTCDPWSMIGLDLIAHYCGRDIPSDADSAHKPAKPARRRAW